MRQLAGWICAVVVLVRGLRGEALLAEAPNPVPASGVAFNQRLNVQVDLDLSFRDEAGRDVRLRDYFGDRPVVLVLVYYECPMLCTLILNGLVRCLRALSFDVGTEFEIIAVSFDPGETPELAAAKKRAYLRMYDRAGAGSGWHFLTGEAGPIHELTEAVGFRAKYDPETDEYAHASGLVVLTPKGKVSRYLFGLEFAPRDLRLAIVEASEDKVGSLVDEILLLCLRYDPRTGKYSMAVMNVVRAVSAATVLILVATIWALLRRERRKRGEPLGPGGAP